MDKLIFTPSEEDLRDAYRLHTKQVKWKRLLLLVSFGGIVGAIIAAFDGFFDSIEKTLGLIGGLMLWAGFLAGLLVFILPLFWIPYYAKKVYKQQKELHLETTTWWDDDKLYSNNEQSTAQIKFADILKWRADSKILLLYRSEQLFNFLPNHAFQNISQRDALIRRLEDAGIDGERI